MKNERQGIVDQGQENKPVLENPFLKSFVDFSIGLFVGLETQSVWKISINSTNIPKQNNGRSVNYLKVFEVIYNNSAFFDFSSQHYNSINGVKIEDMLTKEINKLKKVQKEEMKEKIKSENEKTLKKVAARLLGPIIMMQDMAGKPNIFEEINPYAEAKDLSIDDASKIIKTSIKAGYENRVRDVIDNIKNKTIKKTVYSWIKELSPNSSK